MLECSTCVREVNSQGFDPAGRGGWLVAGWKRTLPDAAMLHVAASSAAPATPSSQSCWRLWLVLLLLLLLRQLLLLLLVQLQWLAADRPPPSYTYGTCSG